MHFCLSSARASVLEVVMLEVSPVSYAINVLYTPRGGRLCTYICKYLDIRTYILSTCAPVGKHR